MFELPDINILCEHCFLFTQLYQFFVSFSLVIQVSRQSKQFLALMAGRPLLKIEKLNPALFKFVVELREVKVRFTIMSFK